MSTNPQREELRKAIERHAAALHQLDAVRTSQELEREARSAKRHTLGAAIGRLAQATTDPEKQAARLVVAKARDELNEAIKDQQRLQKEYAVAENDLQNAADEVIARVRDVVRSDPSTRQLASEFVDLQRQISELRPVMELLSGSMLPDRFRYWRAEPGPPPHNLIREAWERAIADLHVDPDAKLP